MESCGIGCGRQTIAAAKIAEMRNEETILLNLLLIVKKDEIATQRI